MENNGLSPDAPAPRLCILTKWDDFEGYGFNLHGEKTKPGQYIGKVDKDSPAESAGLRPRDRILEVNGVNISNENHKQVVERIKSEPNSTQLLVVDDKAEEYYRTRGIIVTHQLPNVITLKTRARESSSYDRPGTGESSSSQAVPELEETVQVSDTASNASSSINSKNNSLKKMSGAVADDEFDYVGCSPGASPSPTPLQLFSSLDSSKGSNNSLDLNMTAQEMRAKLKARKADKADPKQSKMDLRKKYDIIQTL